MAFEQIDLVHLPLPVTINSTVEEVKEWNKWGLGYRQMCRFFSQFLFWWPSLLQYDWYWRLDTDSWSSFFLP